MIKAFRLCLCPFAFQQNIPTLTWFFLDSPFCVFVFRPLPAPNLSRTFTPKELLKFDGSDVDKPIYVAIKGNVFDVSTKKDMYGPKGGYKCFAGRDSSKVKKDFFLPFAQWTRDFSQSHQ